MWNTAEPICAIEYVTEPIDCKKSILNEVLKSKIISKFCHFRNTITSLSLQEALKREQKQLSSSVVSNAAPSPPLDDASISATCPVDVHGQLDVTPSASVRSSTLDSKSKSSFGKEAAREGQLQHILCVLLRWSQIQSTTFFCLWAVLFLKININLIYLCSQIVKRAAIIIKRVAHVPIISILFFGWRLVWGWQMPRFDFFWNI